MGKFCCPKCGSKEKTTRSTGTLKRVRMGIYCNNCDSYVRSMTKEERKKYDKALKKFEDEILNQQFY